MEETRQLLPASKVLAEVLARMGRIDPDRGLLSDADRLALVSLARQVDRVPPDTDRDARGRSRPG